MAAAVGGAIFSSSFSFLRIITPPQRPPRARRCFCSRKDDNAADLSQGPQIQFDGHPTDGLEESVSFTAGRVGVSSSDIWKLFNDAQRNILYLNKQRCMAVEELNKMKRENELLLARLEQLDAGKQGDFIKGTTTDAAKSSSFCELLLRIDSMVLSGMISLGETSELRNVVIGNQLAIPNIFRDIQQKEDEDLLSQLRHFSEKTMRKGLHIVHICTEMEPIASVGSLASYVMGLSVALQRKGNLVEVILPKYGSIDEDTFEGLRKTEAEFDSYFAGFWHKNRVWTGVISGIGITLIEPLYNVVFFNNGNIYGHSDDFERFTYFSRASLDYLVKTGKQPDILHIHNWETALVAPLFWDVFVHQGLGGTRVLFTCQELTSQCLQPPEKLALCGLDPLRLNRPDRLQDNNNTKLVNILKGGIVYSNKVVAMSMIHSRDTAVYNLNHGLESTLAIHKEKLLIAPYGIDGVTWDPSSDKFLPRKYSADNIEGKAACKVALLHRLGFSGHLSAIVGCIYSEISEVDMASLKATILYASRKGAQFVFMGLKAPSANTPLQLFQDELQANNIRFINKYDEALAHLILAGSDIMLCSSFHDPMLQIPLKAIKYGSAPVVMNTRSDFSRHYLGREFRSTMFSQYILSTYANMSLSQALDEIKNDPSQWTWKIKDGMSRDFSWDAECHDIHLAAYMSIKNL